MKCEGCIHLIEIKEGIVTCKTFDVIDGVIVKEAFHERPNKGCKHKRIEEPISIENHQYRPNPYYIRNSKKKEKEK